MDNFVARAIIAPVRALKGKRSQIRYLQVAENVASIVLFASTANDSNYDDASDD